MLNTVQSQCEALILHLLFPVFPDTLPDVGFINGFDGCIECQPVGMQLSNLVLDELR